MVARSVSSVLERRQALGADELLRFGPALAFPLLFLHLERQPRATLALGPTDATVAISDLGILAFVALALLAARHGEAGRLRVGAPLWIAAGLLLAFVFAETFIPLASHPDYPWQANLVSAAKFAEYAVLAPAVVLLVRAPRDLAPLAAAIVAWTVAMGAVALVQFAGLMQDFQNAQRFGRVPSLVGIEDYGVLGGAALAVGFTVVTLGRRRRGERAVGKAGIVAGGLGVVLSAALAGLIGAGAAAAVALVAAARRGTLTVRRAVAVATVLAVVAVGVFAMRSGDIGDFLAFLGFEEREQTGQVETYAHRTLMAYVGWQIFLDNPVLGSGWQGSTQEYAYGPQIEAARERFPDAPLRAFPTPAHPWGPHNLFIQALSDLGVGGLVLFVSLFAAGFLFAARALRGPPDVAAAGALAAAWLAVVVGVANGRGIVAGIPWDALLWIAVGLAVAAASWTRRGTA